ncbi:hypothetical protein AA0243_1775 [Novacetimonas hansenii NRIC 0243]|nr:hypothetical protein AA0243_1775 [Novacetimonas hansenii NRIC 0243]
MKGGQVLAVTDKPVGNARHRRDDNRDLASGIDLFADLFGNSANPLQIGHGCATEFHNDPRYGSGHWNKLSAVGQDSCCPGHYHRWVVRGIAVMYKARHIHPPRLCVQRETAI